MGLLASQEFTKFLTQSAPAAYPHTAIFPGDF